MTKKINVLYIITKLELGGAQKICLSLFNGLNEIGHDSLLITGSEGTLTKSVRDNKNVIFLETFKREFSFKNIYLELRNFLNLVRKIKHIKKEYPNLIVHTHSSKAGIIGRWAALFAGIKTRIHTIHGFAFHSHQNKLIWFSIYLLELLTSFITTKFVCVSNADIKTGIKLFPGFKHKYSLIRAAVEIEKFIPAKVIRKKHFVFGSIACFKPQKNLLDLLKAFQIVVQKNSNCTLEIIGDGQMRAQIENWINDNNMQNKIVLHGWQTDTAKIMEFWDAFALSSLWEGLPCAIIEARLMKLPVISYDTGGISDVILNGKNGFLCQQRDYETLAENMLKIFNDIDLYNSTSDFKDNFSDFDNQIMIKKHIQLYKSF